MTISAETRFTRRLPLQSGEDMPDRFRVTLAGMMTEGWLLYGAWAVGGLVLALLGHWQVALATSGIGILADVLFQRQLRALWRNNLLSAEQGIRRLVPIVVIRFSLGVAGPIVIMFTAHSAPAMAVVMMLQAWSICVAMVQFSAVPRLFLIASIPPLLAVAAAVLPLLREEGPALVTAFGLLIVILAVISRQRGQMWTALSQSWAENVDLIAGLREARAAADAASAAKSTFLATMSHEVRTPLNGILGVAQVMALRAVDDDQRADLQIIRKSGESLLATLNAVLDLSRIEAGRLELVESDIIPSDIVQSSVDAFAAMASLKGVRLYPNVDSSALGSFRGDPVRIRQVLDNLLGNALKFTERGQVQVKIMVQADQLSFEVIDTGPGISQTDLSRIFSPFQQLDGSHGRAHDGSGLGLSISMELAKLMGGALEVESLIGEGSTFRLVLPAIPGEAKLDHQAAAPTLGSAPGSFSVLVAEDHPTNQLVIKCLLQHMGADVEIVEHGKAALDRLAERSFDVVLMDVHMPVMDGLIATREIRSVESAQGNRRTPVVGVTGNAMDHQVAECLDAGMDLVVAKPIELSVLVDAIYKAVNLPSPPLLREAAPAVATHTS